MRAITSMELEHIFSEPTITKILDFLIDNRGHDYSKTEIAHRSGVSWSTISRHWHILQEWDLVTRTRAIGRATMYTLNEDSAIVAYLIALDAAATRWRSHIGTNEVI